MRSAARWPCIAPSPTGSGRPKDLAFCVALLRDAIVDRATLRDRLTLMPDLPDAIRAVIAARMG